MLTAPGGPRQDLRPTDPVLVHYHRAIEAEAQMRRLAMAIGACDGAERLRDRRSLLVQEAAAAARFNTAYRSLIATRATTELGVIAKTLLHAQCTRDGADPLDDELAASIVADVDRLNLLPLSAAMLQIATAPRLSAAFRATDGAFSSAAAAAITPTDGMVAAGAQAGQVQPDRARSIFTAMWDVFMRQVGAHR